MNNTLYGNDMRAWLIAILVAVVTMVVLQFVRRIIINKYATSLADRTGTYVDNMVVGLLQKTHYLFVLLVSLYVGALVLALPAQAQQIINTALIIGLIIQSGLWGQQLVIFWLDRYRSGKIEDTSTATVVAVLGLVGKIAVWSVVVLLILDNLGVEITALVASLGIGAVAIGLAVQNVLGDLFASVSILLDKPFQVGDFIIVGDYLGTVEKVGIQTTRLRSLSGEQLVFSNTDLIESRIQNYKRMQERRVPFTIGVLYETPYEKLEAIPGMLREIIESQEQTRFDRAHFKEYGDSALVYEIVYYVLSADYNIYMDVQQAINLAIFRRFQEEGIEFAYPTRTLHIARQPEDEPLPDGYKSDNR